MRHSLATTAARRRTPLLASLNMLLATEDAADFTAAECGTWLREGGFEPGCSLPPVGSLTVVAPMRQLLPAAQAAILSGLTERMAVLPVGAATEAADGGLACRR